MAASDPNYGYSSTQGITGPANLAFAITPGTADLPYRTRALWVGTGGTVVIVDTAGTQVTLANVPNGTLLPIRVDKVLAASTASNLVGLY